MRITISYRKNELGQSYGAALESNSVDKAIEEFIEANPGAVIDNVVCTDVAARPKVGDFGLFGDDDNIMSFGQLEAMRLDRFIQKGVVFSSWANFTPITKPEHIAIIKSYLK